MKVKGRVWKFGDNIDTDLIIPARYLNTSDPKELAKHVMEDADSSFPSKVKQGDIIIAGRNFGCGSSREHAPIAIKSAGVQAVIAKSFARIFFRNAFNMGLPIFEVPELVDETDEGDTIEINLDLGEIVNLTKSKKYKTKPIPPFMQELIRTGGLIEWTKKRMEVIK